MGMCRTSTSTPTATRLTVEQMVSSVSASARWNKIERKVTYGFRFKTESGDDVYDSGYISKSAAKQEAKAMGATKEQLDKLNAELKKINPATYRR